jgi:hypothetical protein
MYILTIFATILDVRSANRPMYTCSDTHLAFMYTSTHLYFWRIFFTLYLVRTYHNLSTRYANHIIRRTAVYKGRDEWRA